MKSQGMDPIKNLSMYRYRSASYSKINQLLMVTREKAPVGLRAAFHNWEHPLGRNDQCGEADIPVSHCFGTLGA